MKKLLLVFIWIYTGTFCAFGQSDTQLDFETFMLWVKENHPIAQQAQLQLQMGDMAVRTARGGFDPLIYGNLDRKNYGGTDYYEKRQAGVDIPTWMGVELNGSFEQNSGQYLNPEYGTPDDGLIAVGASVNLGQGLILDKRRAALRQAQLYQESTEFERRQYLNELYLQATDMYWRWALAYANQQVIEEAVELAETRFQAVKGSFRLGDVAAIDTVESYSQLLNRQYKAEAARNTLFQTVQELNTFLWNESGEPMILEENIYPEAITVEEDIILNEAELRQMVSTHPSLQIADLELATLAVERKLKAQQIIPVVKLKYNFLTENLNDFENSSFFESDYKWGVSIYTPLFWRKSRGELGMAKAKIDVKQNTRDLKELQLRTKLEAELNNFSNLTSQISIFSKNLSSLNALLTGEMRRFEIGESSLFLVNSREVSVIDSRITLNELIKKRKVAQAKARVAAGIGFDQ
ncbi:TolC family protein [Algoriphagus halophytocola]|uniref:TolC family protein n=1 Tax=Algoriphagus halophytocola TaxID=2991499 RepID=A0ABY6MH85_9BACT|nr:MULTISPECIES: TolC family protein [unclassified Algoriphagus]UZD23157.1 TolC family protein [Algoriphagus sp. TR-M5]WBL44449.1 TolC family protein [Algoriphagus sp. TR-M9]